MTDITEARSARVNPERLSRVWEPLTIGNTTVKNRIMMTAQSVLYGENQLLGDRHVEYYRERARGGCALFICEQQGGHPIATGSFHEGCSAYDPRSIPQYAKLAEAVHEHGGRQFVQLYAPGVHDKGNMIMDNWHPLWAVSRTTSVVHKEVPYVMEKEDIAELVDAFAQSALNVKCSGCDGVELHAAHSYLFGQFLSPAYNFRTDEYGGSVANRARILVELGDAIRKRVGTDFTVGVRLSFDEFMGDAGITPEQTEEVLEILAATGYFDFFNISGGGYHTLHMAVAPMSVNYGFMLPFGKRAKEIVGDRARVFIVGRIVDLEMAEDALADGCADMVAMTRAQMAEPHLIKKTREGRQQEIFGCMGANECVARSFENRPSACLVNPTVERERQWGSDKLNPVSEEQRKRIIVVGGGLSGMHTAQIAARRGHQVSLWEASDRLGGHLNLLQALPTRKEWAVAIDNLRRAMQTHGVDVRLNTTATVESLNEASPDAVVIATGSSFTTDGYSQYRPERRSIPGHDQAHVLDVGTAAQRALEDPTSLGRRILIVDQTGDYLPVGLAELLATQGKAAVEILTPYEMVGEDVLRRLEYPHVIPRITGAGVKLTTQMFVEAIGETQVELYPVWGGERRTTEVDTVVISINRVPDEALYRACEGQFPQLERVGDCVAPRRPAALTHDAEALGRRL